MVAMAPLWQLVARVPVGGLADNVCTGRKWTDEAQRQSEFDPLRS